MKISREDVLRIAELAHLELSSEEVELYRGQLDAILTYIDKLKELDVSSVEPMAQALGAVDGHATRGHTHPYGATRHTDTYGEDKGPHPELREDRLRPCETAEALFGQAAGAQRPFFRVPKVIER
jgi:aspartyl-tRNA(Asn)/glutamyl-tRNA(Gln) amidotransferase subunit C